MRTLKMFGVHGRAPEPSSVDTADLLPNVLTAEQVEACLERLDRMNTPSSRAAAARIRLINNQ